MSRLIFALAVAAAPALAMAQEHAHGTADGAAAAYAAANAAMHEAMAIDYSGDPDVDFARAMIPHHEGAIAMAEVLLANGEDPALRQMAGEIISAQEAEIAVLRQWLAEHGG